MPKQTSQAIREILQLYGVFIAESTSRDISNIKKSHPDSHSTVYSFNYQTTPYIILFDNNIDNNEADIFNILPKDVKLKNAKLIKSTKTHNFASFYKGKTVYLCQLERPLRRLDYMLTSKHPNLSRALIQKYIKSGYAMVNSKIEKSPSKLIKVADNISLNVPSKTVHTGESFKIIYKDQDVIVIDKPSGVLTHAKGALTDEFTVADFFARFSSYNSGTNRPGIVHRLDRDTSGVILGALNEDSAKYLQKQFSNRTVKKTYYAIIKGRPKLEKAIIDLPIERNPAKPSQFRVGPGGKSAQTYYEVVESVGAMSLVRLEPKTGRTHQLRAHLAHIGNPIIGDRVYGQQDDRLYLHASRLELTLPGGNRKVFESKLPTSFAKRIENA